MLPLLALATVTFFFSIVPTVTYSYAERRSRAQWSDAQSPAATAPRAVKIAAWVSLALGQLAIPWLLVPAACVVVLVGLSKVGAASATLWGVLGTTALVAVLQSVVAFRLFPFGVRLLARDKQIRARARSVAKMLFGVNVAALGAAGLAFALVHIPSVIHPVLAKVVHVGIVLPVAFFGALGLASALLVTGAGYAATRSEK